MARVIIIAKRMRVKMLERYGFDHSAHDIDLVALSNIDFANFIRDRVKEARKRNSDIAGIFGLNDISNLIASIISQRANLNGPNISTLLKTQIKPYLRDVEQRCFPECHVRSEVLNEDNISEALSKVGKPAFSKPAKSVSLHFSFVVEDEQRLREIYHRWKKEKENINNQFKQVCELITGAEKQEFDFQNRYMVEEFIEAPDQVTIDGFVYGGSVSLYGTTQSSFLPQSLSFKSFDFPYAWSSSEFKQKVSNYIKRCIDATDLDNTLFNIELKLNPETESIFLIELNTRVSPQFIFMFKHVLGYNPLKLGVEIAAGSEPSVPQVEEENRKSVARCFILRRGEDGIAQTIPSEEQISSINHKYSGDGVVVSVSSFIEENKKLSSLKQDTHSFRYGQIKVAGNSDEELVAVAKRVKEEFEKLFTFRS